MISAAAGAVAVGGPPGAPSPSPGVPDVAVVVHGPADPAPVVAPGPWECGEWTRSWSPAEHAAAVERVRAAIARGEVYQANVVGHRSAPCAGDPAAALDAVAGLPGAAYGGMLGGEGWAVASGSPECLLTVAGGRLTTRPIKGTRPRTATGRAELYASAKERAEHVMIVDLERNDLSRVARTGSVRVEELFALRSWCDLWQAESVVSADLADGTDLAAVLRAVLPGGSVTGAPKSSALRLVGELEPVGRGPAMGALGYLTPDCLDLGLTIRTIAVAEDTVHLWTGGGITWGSDPWAEVAEADAKAAPVLAALRSVPRGPAPR
jgi:para-aminobenzoate synthetase component 1